MRSLFVVFASLSASVWAAPQIELTPQKIAIGEVSLIRVTPPKGAELPSDLSVSAGATAIPLWECPKQKRSLCGLVSTPFEARVHYPVSVKWTEGEKAQAHVLSLRLVEKKYPRTSLKVAPGKTNPDPSDQEKIDKDREEFKAIYAAPTATSLWNEKFQLPTKGVITSAFGSQRVFNGEVKTVHYGVDLRAGVKTPIKSANAGKVVFAREAFFGGNMVVIDHGMGIYTSYSHLSVIGVTVGQSVKRGEKIGMAGATGRVTGPHLHWAVRVNGLSVDPFQFRKTFGRMWETAVVPTRVSSAGNSAR